MLDRSERQCQFGCLDQHRRSRPQRRRHLERLGRLQQRDGSARSAPDPFRVRPARRDPCRIRWTCAHRCSAQPTPTSASRRGTARRSPSRLLSWQLRDNYERSRPSLAAGLAYSALARRSRGPPRAVAACRSSLLMKARCGGAFRLRSSAYEQAALSVRVSAFTSSARRLPSARAKRAAATLWHGCDGRGVDTRRRHAGRLPGDVLRARRRGPVHAVLAWTVPVRLSVFGFFGAFVLRPRTAGASALRRSGRGRSAVTVAGAPALSQCCSAAASMTATADMLMMRRTVRRRRQDMDRLGGAEQHRADRDAAAGGDTQRVVGDVGGIDVRMISRFASAVSGESGIDPSITACDRAVSACISPSTGSPVPFPDQFERRAHLYR